MIETISVPEVPFEILTEPANLNDKLTLGFYSDKNVDSEIQIAYRLYVPENIDKNKKYALMIFLHGAGERGSDGNHLSYKVQAQFIKNIVEDDKLKEQFIVFAPQCPNEMQWVNSDWHPGKYDFTNTPQSIPEALVMSYIEKEILGKYEIDKSRIYVTGLSMGGFGTWDLITRYPDLFAAAMPICGGCDVKTAEAVKHIPIRIYHGDKDTAVLIDGEIDMAEELTKLGSDIKMTVLQGLGHDAWVYGYGDKEVFDWFISQRKK